MRSAAALAIAFILVFSPYASSEDLSSSRLIISNSNSILMEKPSIKGVRGFQGATWVQEEAAFYSTWNRRNSDGSERVNIVRHDQLGRVIDYSETTGQGSASPIRLGHGQTIDHLTLNGVLTFVTSSEGNRGVTLFEREGAGNGWKLRNVRTYILQPKEVTASTVALSIDKASVVLTGGPYKGHKNIRVWALAALLNGPQGDRTRDGTPFEEMMQPKLLHANQGIVFDGNKLLMLNGDNNVLESKKLTTIDWINRSVVNTTSLNNGQQLALSQNRGNGDWYEPEGLFVGPGGKTLWMGMGTQDKSGRSWASYIVPVIELK